MIDIALAQRITLRRDSADPKCVLSSTDTELWHTAFPTALQLLPSLRLDRSEKLDPRARQLSTDTRLPSRMLPRTEMAEPTADMSMTLHLEREPTRTAPCTDTALPTRKMARTDTDDPSASMFRTEAREPVSGIQFVNMGSDAAFWRTLMMCQCHLCLRLGGF